MNSNEPIGHFTQRRIIWHHLDHVPIDRHLLLFPTIIFAATLTTMDAPTSKYCLAFSTITPLAYRLPLFKTRQTLFLPKHQPASWNPSSVQNFGSKITSLHALQQRAHVRILGPNSMSQTKGLWLYSQFARQIFSCELCACLQKMLAPQRSLSLTRTPPRRSVM